MFRRISPLGIPPLPAALADILAVADAGARVDVVEVVVVVGGEEDKC
jgi:hypothetical protein